MKQENSQITIADIAENGDIIFTGYFEDEKKVWVATQEDLLFFLELQTKENDIWAPRRKINNS